MKIKEVTVRRIFNLGNFETIHIELKADKDETESVEGVLNEKRKN